jgi:hypothetical protein
MKILCTIAALACGLALAAAPAHASDRTIPFEVRLADRAVTCADSDLFGIPFARGTVTAPMTLHEVLPTESLTLQRGKGRVSAGTGAYARARGSVEGGGFLEFTATGVESALFYVVRLK